MHCKQHRDWAGASATNKAMPAQKAMRLSPLSREARLLGKAALPQKRTMTRQHCSGRGKFAENCKLYMTARLPGGRTCQELLKTASYAKGCNFAKVNMWRTVT